MPIKPENRSKYPPNWREISLRIRARANNCCEECGVRNGVTGARDKRGEWHDECAIDFMNSGEGMSLFGVDYPKIIRIVLTVAHLNHDEADCSDENLKCLCQLHHLRHDAQHHASSAAVTRAAQKTEAAKEAGQMSLF